MTLRKEILASKKTAGLQYNLTQVPVKILALTDIHSRLTPYSIAVVFKNVGGVEETKTRDKMTLFILRKENSVTWSKKKSTLFVADFTIYFLIGFKDRKTWGGIFKSIKERYFLWQIVIHSTLGLEVVSLYPKT